MEGIKGWRLVAFAFADIVMFSTILFSYLQLRLMINLIFFRPDHIIILQPFKLRSRKLAIDQIQGYSTSEFYYGGKLLIKSCSFIIYSNGRAYEFLKHSLINYDELLKSLRSSGITKFGREPFDKSWFRRIFRYVNS